MVLRFSFFLSLILLFSACADEDLGDLTEIPYEPIPLEIDFPDFFPDPVIPADNPITEAGFELGRKLFYDPILSIDSTVSCASCHLQNGAFTDNLAVSIGVEMLTGKRSSMSLLNVAYFNNGLFWDGRSTSLEEQAVLPVEDPVEQNHSWPRLIEQLQTHPTYPQDFRKAFGIEHTDQITRELAAKALAQFERSIVSSGNSKYDRWVAGTEALTDQELAGFDMYFDTNPDLPDAECGHCHNAPFFTTNEYFNNGIDSVQTLNDFVDKGRGAVTNVLTDNGKFRAPSLRNILDSAPYMHDGRFQTLREVIEHYNSGGFIADNVDPLIRPLGLNEEQILALEAFILTLQDDDVLSDERYSNPF